MAGRREKPLVRKDEPSQRTKEGLEIPVPKRHDFFGAVDKAAKKPGSGKEPSRADPERP